MSEWSTRCNYETIYNKILERLLSKHPAMAAYMENSIKVAYYYNDANEYVPRKYAPQIEVKVDDKYHGRYCVCFALIPANDTYPIISFNLDLYPECCALHQLNNFFCVAEMDVVFVKDFVEFCISVYTSVVNTVKRIMINFVESPRNKKYTARDVVPELDHYNIHHPAFYLWAKSYPTQETLFVNHNSGNIIHNVIVNYYG